MDRRTKLATIGKCLDRYEAILETTDLNALTEFRKNRFDRFIDLDVSKVDLKKLASSTDGDFVHDMTGVFNNLERNSDDPSKSTLKLFVPRCGFETDA